MTNQCSKSRSGMFSWTGLAMISVLLFSVVVLLSGTRLGAQITNGINGTVADSSGAVIPAAEVTVTNNSTHVVSHAVTSSAGTFIVVGLNPGQYSVAVVAAGFKKSVNSDVLVEVSKMSATS